MPVTKKDDGFPLVLEMSKQGVKESFRDGSQIARFFQEELRRWNELTTEVLRAPLVGANIATAAGYQAAKDALANLGSPDDINSCFLVLSRFDAERPIVLQGAVGKLITDREGETPAQTSGTLWAAAAMLGGTRLQNVTNQAVPSRDLAAILFGQTKLSSGLQRLRGERANLRRLVGELGDEIGEAKANNAATTQHLAKSTAELSDIIAKNAGDIARLFEETEKGLGTFVEAVRKQVSAETLKSQQTLAETVRISTEEIEDFKRKVRIDVGLEEPTNFWTEKADGHRVTAAIFGALFLAAVVGMVVWIESSAVGLVAEAVDRIVGNRDAAALTLVPIAFITVPALAFAWVLRHLSRIIIQNLSLEADARLRGTITRTFKALAADRAMNDAELAIALQALFRPIDGKDHSEIAPPSLADILKLGDGKPG